MKQLNLVQGTPEWKEARRNYFTASEASAMMGCNPKVSRNELLRMKATGDGQEFSDWVLNVLFERGHNVEAAARPRMEENLKDELYPSTVVDESKNLLASLDGITMDGTIIWECKQWNQFKADCLESGVLPDVDKWQVVQQLVISRADYCIYEVTDNEGKSIKFQYTLTESDEAELLAGWDLFRQDLDNYKPVERIEEPTGKAPDKLPALNIQLTGEVTQSNLDSFKEHALAVFGGINKTLSTDKEFADAAKTVTWCKKVEEKLELAKQNALEQTVSIASVFETIDAVKEEARQVRLDLDKLVTKRKREVREEILQNAKKRYNVAFQAIVESIPVGFSMPVDSPDFSSAMKGKKKVSSLQDAVDQVLADSKISLKQRYDALIKNIKAYVAHAEGYEFLFADKNQLVAKETEDLINVIKLRIQNHKDELDRQEKLKAVQEDKAQYPNGHDPVTGEILPQETELKSVEPKARLPPKNTLTGDTPETKKLIAINAMDRTIVNRQITGELFLAIANDEIPYIKFVQ